MLDIFEPFEIMSTLGYGSNVPLVVSPNAWVDFSNPKAHAALESSRRPS